MATLERAIGFGALALLAAGCTNDRRHDTPAAVPVMQSSVSATVEFDSLYRRIRDGLLSRHDAESQFRAIVPRLSALYYGKGGGRADSSTWRFPLQGYSARAIGGTNGSGYIVDGYDFFDGNVHKGHPAQDIFIRDRNQDDLDDVTHRPVTVLSISPGIVVAMATTWDSSSTLRGGKYIWIYDPNSRSFFYYAHNGSVLVGLLDIVKAGDPIATVGRTGLNAFKQRSPTHLHVMRLVVDSTGMPRPVDLFSQLKRAGR